jgi:lysozyme
MNPSPSCLDLIRNSEGCQLKAYRDCAGVLTIGYGHTGPDVKPGMKITWTQAEALLGSDALVAAEAVEHLAGPCTQGQFDAFVDFVFNFGATRFSTSTLLHKHKAGNFTGAAAEFGKWIYAGQPPRPEPGLIKRRAAETHLYLSDQLPHDVKVSDEEDDGA